MPGGFAHIQVVSHALGDLQKVAGLTNAQKLIARQFQPYVEIGAVAPDYPYLGFQSNWADQMHYNRTANNLKLGIDHLRSLENPNNINEALPWLMGYAAHMATDLTIHPIVELRVGEYALNKTDHRICEMHQDTYIWQKRDLGDIGLADYFKKCFQVCSNQDGELPEAILSIWSEILTLNYPELMDQEKPDINRWHKGFHKIIDAVDDLGPLFPFTRHILSDHGIAYPNSEDIDMAFIEGLETPEGSMHYDDLFDKAVQETLNLWSLMGNALNETDPQQYADFLNRLPNGNLDTGRDLHTNQYLMWNNT